MCPPGVDQTTRTTQRWTLLTPLLGQKYDITNDFCKFSESRPEHYILGDYTWDAFDKLARYNNNDSDVLSKLTSLPMDRKAEQSSAIERLPTEITSMIISDPALNIKDLVALGLSAQFLWLHVLEHAQKDCLKAPWALTPLLCTGSWLMALPPAIHSLYPDIAQDEKAFFSPRGSRGSTGRGMCPARQFNWNAVDSYLDRADYNRRDVWKKGFDQVSVTSGIQHKFLALRRSLAMAIARRRPARAERWMLRNHTMNEYITLKCSHMYGNQEQYVYVSGMPWLSLDRALIMRISWSASYFHDDEDEIDEESALIAEFKRGKWAGHCFDVVSKDVGIGDQWQDVTQEVLEDAKKWKSTFKDL